MNYTIITLDCGVMGTYEHLYRDGILVEQDDSDGWYDIHWKTALKTLGIPFGEISLDDSKIPEDFLPTRLEEWDKYL